MGEALADERHIQFPPKRVRRDLEEVIAWVNASWDLAADAVVRRTPLRARRPGARGRDARPARPRRHAARAPGSSSRRPRTRSSTPRRLSEASLGPPLDFGGPEALVEGDAAELLWRQSMWETIGGGTSEVMRGVVAKQALGLGRAQLNSAPSARSCEHELRARDCGLGAREMSAARFFGSFSGLNEPSVNPRRRSRGHAVRGLRAAESGSPMRAASSSHSLISLLRGGRRAAGAGQESLGGPAALRESDLMTKAGEEDVLERACWKLATVEEKEAYWRAHVAKIRAARAGSRQSHFPIHRGSFGRPTVKK